MSFKAYKWASDQNTGSSSKKSVLLCLAEMANEEKGYLAWPAIGTISRITELSERTVQRCLKDLKNQNLINIRRFGGRDRPNHYKLNVKPRHDDTLKVSNNEMDQSIKGDTVSLKGVIDDTKPRHDVTQTIKNPKNNYIDHELTIIGISIDMKNWKIFISLINESDESVCKFLGLQVKKYGKENVNNAIDKVIQYKPVNAKSYLIGILRNEQNKPSRSFESTAERATRKCAELARKASR